MKLAFKQIKSFLNNPPEDVCAVLFYGPNTGLAGEQAKALGLKTVSDLSDPFNVATFTQDSLSEDPASFTDEAYALSLMGGKRLLRLQNAADGATAALTQILDNPPQDCFIIVEAGDLKTSSSLRKLFEKSKVAAAIPCYLEDGRNISGKIRDMCQHAGYHIGRDAQQILADALAGDSKLLSNEVEKLLLYKGLDEDYEGPEGEPLRKRLGEITTDDVFACNPDMRIYSLDELINAAATGNTATAHKIAYKVLQEGVPNIVLLRALLRHFRRLHITLTRLKDGQNLEQAHKKLQPPVFWKYKDTFNAQIHKWTLPRLDAVLEEIAFTEAKTKMSANDNDMLCTHLVLNISRIAATL